MPYMLRLSGIAQLVEFINQKEAGCPDFKKDLWQGYRQIPHDRHNYHFIRNDDWWHVLLSQLCLLDYESSATLECRRTTKAVAYILNKQGLLVDVYTDDFYGAKRKEHVNTSFYHMTQLLNDHGL